MMSVNSLHKDHLHQIFQSAVNAVHPDNLIKQWIRRNGNMIQIGEQVLRRGLTFDRIFVVGAGKAAASMAIAVEDQIGDLIHEGLVITKYGHTLPTKKIQIIEASHPIPDLQSVLATQQLLKLLSSASKNDLVICLLSGGASALMTDLPNNISLDDLEKLNEALLFSGCNIHEINLVRKHLSMVKGGRLIRYCRNTKVISLIISDVPGDDISVIASGPTVPYETDFRKALSIVERLQEVPESIFQSLKLGIVDQGNDSINMTDSIFEKVQNHIIGTNQMALHAAAESAKKLGYEVLLLKSPVTGNTEVEAVEFVEQLMYHKNKRKYCFIQGGETTITVKGDGKGGRNQHFALKALQQLTFLNRQMQIYFEQHAITDQASYEISILSAGTDGTDGPTEAAGAIVHLFMNCNLEEMNQYLDKRDSYSFHKKYGNLFITGPTQTNVMDLMIGLIN